MKFISFLADVRQEEDRMKTYNSGNLVDLTDVSDNNPLETWLKEERKSPKTYNKGNLVDLTGVSDDKLIKMGLKEDNCEYEWGYLRLVGTAGMDNNLFSNTTSLSLTDTFHISNINHKH